MKVLLVTSSYKNSWPFLPELRHALLKKKVKVHVLDITTLKLIDEEGKVISGGFVSRLNSIKGGHRFIRFTASAFISKNLGMYDAINIHNLEYIYLYLVDELRCHTKNLSISIWGSDFYRASERRILSYDPLFKKLDFIGFGNKYTQEDFDARIPGFTSKHRIASFGIGKFEILHNLLPQRNQIKKELGIPLDKITVVCGYNAFEAQQHLIITNQIKLLPEKLKKEIFLLFPLTYGGNKHYISEIQSAAQETGCDYKAFTGFATDEDIAKIRVVGDVILNAQISDSFSASLQEHVLCNSILIAGAWLPYQVMTDLGLKYFPVDLDSFGTQLEEVVYNYDSFRAQVKDNSQILYNEGVWENRIDGWINLYKGTNDQAVS